MSPFGVHCLFLFVMEFRSGIPLCRKLIMQKTYLVQSASLKRALLQAAPWVLFFSIQWNSAYSSSS